MATSVYTIYCHGLKSQFSKQTVTYVCMNINLLYMHMHLYLYKINNNNKYKQKYNYKESCTMVVNSDQSDCTTGECINLM